MKQKLKIKSENKKNHLPFLVYSLKSLARLSNLSDKCLWSDANVASINPIVNTAPKLKTNKEIIISSTDQEPPRINLIIWYAKNMPKITNKIITTCLTNSIVLFSNLANTPANEPEYKHNYNQYDNKKQPMNHVLFHELSGINLVFKPYGRAFLRNFLEYELEKRANYLFVENYFDLENLKIAY